MYILLLFCDQSCNCVKPALRFCSPKTIHFLSSMYLLFCIYILIFLDKIVFFCLCFVNQLTSVGLKKNDDSLLRLNTVYVVTGYCTLSFIEIVSFFIGPRFDNIIIYKIYKLKPRRYTDLGHTILKSHILGISIRFRLSFKQFIHCYTNINNNN